MKTKSPASGKRQGLDDDSQKIHSSINPSKHTDDLNLNKVLDQIAQKWTDHGYYPTPGAAMEALKDGGI